MDFHMIHYTQIIWEEVAFSWKVTGKAVAISIAPTVLLVPVYGEIADAVQLNL